MITVLLVDDQPAVRRGLRMRLAMEPDITIAGEAEHGADALVLAEALQPDVVLMDVEMPRLDGIAATAALRAIAPGCVVIMLSLYGDQLTRQRAAEAGAAAFVEKHAGDSVLLGTIRRAAGRADGSTAAPRDGPPP